MDSLTVDDRIFAPRQLLGWALFSVTAGFVNGAAVMACNSFVTHVTGNITNLGLDGTTHALLLVATAFIGGAMIAVLMAETMKGRGGLGFLLPLLISFLVLIAIAAAGKAGALGDFGAAPTTRPGFVMLGLLAASMGMVNASIASATANKIRITHLTGPATDLAGNIVRAALGSGEGSRVELRWAALRLSKLFAFASGAALAARVAGPLQFDTFAAAAGILIVAVGFAGAIAVPESLLDDDGAGDDASAASKDGELAPWALDKHAGPFVVERENRRRGQAALDVAELNASRCEDASPLLPTAPAEGEAIRSEPRAAESRVTRGADMR
jgi:uncharacterized membrane protein YoaK (UPF0700 family)